MIKINGKLAKSFNYTLNLNAKNLYKCNTCINKMFNRPGYV
jgi:hypothetical protein